MFGTLISSVTVGAGGAASIDFTSIPQTYTDLLVLFSLRSSSAGGAVSITFNSSSTGFTTKRLEGDGSTTASYSGTANNLATMPQNTTTASTFGNGLIIIPNYAGSANKTFSVDTVGENNAASAPQQLWASLWSNTAAITSLSLTATGFAQYSTVYLYGTLKGSGGASVA